MFFKALSRFFSVINAIWGYKNYYMYTEWSGSCMFIFSNTLFVQQCGSDVCKLGFSLIHNNILEKVSKFQPKTANSFGVMDKNVEARAY